MLCTLHFRDNKTLDNFVMFMNCYEYYFFPTYSLSFSPLMVISTDSLGSDSRLFSLWNKHYLCYFCPSSLCSASGILIYIYLQIYIYNANIIQIYILYIYIYLQIFIFIYWYSVYKIAEQFALNSYPITYEFHELKDFVLINFVHLALILDSDIWGQ